MESTPTSHGVRGVLSVQLKRIARYLECIARVRACYRYRIAVTQNTMCSVVGQLRSLEYVFPCLAPFLRDIEAVTSMSHNLNARMHLTLRMDADMAYLAALLADNTRNRISFGWLLNRSVPGHVFDVLVHTDAATTAGVGGYIVTRNGPSPNFSLLWSESVMHNHRDCSVPDITFYELLGVVAAAELYSWQWTGKTVHFRCDNLAAVYCVIKKSACFRRHDLNALLRRLCGLAHRHRFRFWISHIEGETNRIADALSRRQAVTPFMLSNEPDVSFAVTLDATPTPCARIVNPLLDRAFYQTIPAMLSQGLRHRCACESVSRRAHRMCRYINCTAQSVFQLNPHWQTR
jgi:hypothetical protein